MVLNPTYPHARELFGEFIREQWYSAYHMGRRPIEERDIRKLHKTGGGRAISVTLPIELVRELKWKEKQKVVVTKRGEGLLITDWKKEEK